MTHEESVIRDLRHQHRCAFELLYSSYYPDIERFILANHGTIEDARDIFQETLVVLNKNIAREDFQLTSSLKTYLYAISKNLWLKSLRDNKPLDSFDVDKKEYGKLSDTTEQDKENEARTIHYIENLIAKVPAHCQKIIQYVFYQNIPVDKVAQKMGYQNNHTASNVKYKCLRQMKKASDDTHL